MSVTGRRDRLRSMPRWISRPFGKSPAAMGRRSYEPSAREFKSVLATSILEFLTYKRSLRRRFDTEEATLHLLDHFLAERGIRTLKQISADEIDAFLKSRPRRRPRSYNHLLSTVRRLFDWLVVQGVLNTPPVCARPKR